MDKPFSPACERNREPILKVLKEVIKRDDRRLLEVGSGTGQHAVYFAPHFPHMMWVTSDVRVNLSGIQAWLNESGAPNLVGPGEFEVGKDEFPNAEFDVVYTANSFHIMPWETCQRLMRMLGQNLREGARVLIYGPFNYQGKFTSSSNANFDQSLKAQDQRMGIRHFEEVRQEMAKNGLTLHRDYEMPANNRLLVFIKSDMLQ